MAQNIDETYADNPAYEQAREAHRVALRKLARVVHATLPEHKLELNDVLAALAHNLPFLYAVGTAHDSMLAAGPNHPIPQEPVGRFHNLISVAEESE